MKRLLFFAVLFLSAAAPLAVQAAELSAADQAAIDKAVTGILQRTGVPSASIAVVKDGHIAYLKAYGEGRLDPNVPANPQMRYGIGSISKQFTATAILMLVDEGKLSLDDPVGKYVSGLTDGDKVTIRQILSHTSGYRDYWPQDYVMEEMLHPTTSQHILDKWARIPLDFQPGDEWQYSNTGYTIAGLIVEKVSGEPLMQFLRERIFNPLHMDGATEDDTKPLAATDARGYTRYALGPLHPAPKEAPGWLFAMGGLAMNAHDLALWDIGQIDEKLLKPASYKAQRTAIILHDGKDSKYGLGVDVTTLGRRRMLEHGGEISGFLSNNQVFPDDKAAVVVLTNADFGGAQGAISGAIDDILFPGADQTRVAKAIFDDLRAGRIDRTHFTPNANAYFSAEALHDFAASLGPLGEPQSFVRQRFSLRGGMTSEVYRVTYPDRALTIILRAYPDGKVEQFLVQPST
ncbi:MAG TPA: serine hydrolase domain-containing protein [Caulobacteraceae bacterium]|jgi:CubicO group peptidase (beta-lactamase class C family)|nr:serine hydrolase domain-containing protein [Caulobacteraceae bacterium]